MAVDIAAIIRQTTGLCRRAYVAIAVVTVFSDKQYGNDHRIQQQRQHTFMHNIRVLDPHITYTRT